MNKHSSQQTTKNDAHQKQAIKPVHRPLMNAKLEWNENDQPISTTYNDFYFSTDSGLEETRHTFLKPNRLPERFRELPCGECFTLAETGFGTGLNFMLTWQLFDQLAPADTRLHFISVEKHPLNASDFRKALNLWPELKTYCQQLETLYIPACHGQQHFTFAEGRVRLTLLLGDAADSFTTLSGTIDAWFLDGFSPAKNPGAWQPELFQVMKKKSHPQTTYATYTSARVVQDGLQQAGFSLEKCRGYGKKRDMLFGQITDTEIAYAQSNWHTLPNHKPHQRKAIVIGGGLAGTNSARALAERGWNVTILDRHHALAQEASGNPQGILYAKLSPHHTALSQFILQGYLYCINKLNQLSESTPHLWQQTGVVQLPTSDKDSKRQLELKKQFPASLISDINDQPLYQKGLFFPAAGWVNPALFCEVLAQHPSIQIKTQQAVSHLCKEGNQWILRNKHHKIIDQAETVIMAGGTSSHHLSLLNTLPLKAIRGQISQVKATDISEQLDTCVCAEGYIAPAIDGIHTLGATFDFNDTCPEVRECDHQRNLAMQAEWTPEIVTALGGNSIKITGGRTSFRCTTPDYLPMIGPIVNRQPFLEDFASLRKNAKAPINRQPEYLGGLYINTGHGSRGLITCPLAGEVLAAMITGDTSPIPDHLLSQINPTRFLIRDLIKNQT